ncbi:MAG: hypothetical protein HY735_28130 [Verrucomicrobia bacterium]|nr:hypothetical protein [Verrucomicrobiota bacterium]
MLTATILFSGRDWLLSAAGLVALALLLVWWGYRRLPAERNYRFLAAFLKMLGVLALAICLLEPLWSGQRARPRANIFVLLADNSQGMQIRDRGETQTRGEWLRSLVTDNQAEWQLRLNQDFEVRHYVFDSRLQPSKDFGDLAFDGRASALATSLRTLAERYRGRPLAGVLLLSDGNATDVGAGSPDFTGLPPIYPVIVGKDNPSRDLSIQSVTVNQTSFEDAPVTIQATVAGAGYTGTNILAQLFDMTGRKIEEQTEASRSEDDPVGFRFQLRPEKNGISFYRLRVSAKDELSQFVHADSSQEATLANNSRMLVVDRGAGPYRILYVSGRPNWEYKFLNRALAEDPQIQLVALIRLAKREPKFEFRGRTGESSNPLFRGFDKTSEDTERYDQPVLVRLNVRDAAELRGGFPKAAEELYGYQAVVLDDLESEFFTNEQMTLIQKFVSERGGGFLMLGGQESFHEGKFGRTPVGDMLPVYLDRVAPRAPAKQLRLDLTREGWLQPWTRLRSTEADERARLDSMPPFLVLNRVRDVKPGASVIATVLDERANPSPALIVQRFGHGRTAALTVGDLWHWGLHSETTQRDLAKAWRQLTRWLIADVPDAFQLEVRPNNDANQSVLLQARLRDKKFQPLDNASVMLEVRSESSLSALEKRKAASAVSTNLNRVRIAAEPALSEPGLYQATYVPRETGAYQAVAIVRDSSGVELGRAEVGWTADPAADEFRSLKPNRALLERIAQQTKGEIVAASDLADFASGLPHRAVPITESWTFPLWHTPAMFLFALACFIGEWGLRRWKGLA